MNLYQFKIDGEFYHAVARKIGEALDSVLADTGFTEHQVSEIKLLEEKVTVVEYES